MVANKAMEESEGTVNIPYISVVVDGKQKHIPVLDIERISPPIYETEIQPKYGNEPYLLDNCFKYTIEINKTFNKSLYIIDFEGSWKLLFVDEDGNILNLTYYLTQIPCKNERGVITYEFREV